MTRGILRDVSYEIDKFEMDHYNEDKKGMFEYVQKFLNEIDESAGELYSQKHIDPESISGEIRESLMEANVHIDCMESLGVQNGLVRSKHLQNLMLAAKHRNTRDPDNWVDPDIDYVDVKVAWYLENNLLEQLYLKYHKTGIHECFDMMQRYLVDDDSDYRGIYTFWKEMEELWEDGASFDGETLSNHYHDDDVDWEYDIDPKECKNKKDFFRKRVRAKVQEKKEEERVLLELAKEDKEKEKELKIIRAKEHKLKKYTSIEEFSNQQKGSVYLFADVKQKFAKSKKLPFGVLYVGESRNFNNRFTAYAHKNGDSYSELEKRLINRFPKKSKSEIKEFVRDPEQCKLKVITNKKLSNPYYRKKCERKFIIISQPLLNSKGTK